MKRIKSTLQELFPQLKIENVSSLGSGNDSHAVLVNEKIVFKIPKHQKASNNLIREKQILDLIQGRVTLPIPCIEYNAVLPNGFTLIGYNKLDGITLTREVFDTLTLEEKDNIAKQIALFLKELHQIEIKDNDLFVDKKKKFESDYRTFLLNFSKYLNDRQLDNAKDFFEKTIADVTLYNYKTTLVHNDFGGSNVLFDEETKMISAVIDFGDAIITDRDNDFLCLLEDSDEEYGRDFGIKVLKYYGYSDEEIELAIRKTDINHTFWPYEELLLSEEYNDKKMFKNAIKNLK